MKKQEKMSRIKINNIKNIIIYIMFIIAYDLNCIINATSKNIPLTKCNKSIS